MNEDSKMQEAEYFLHGIAKVASDPNATRFELSAFLSAARSVLQYALEEAKRKPGGQAWYDDAVGVDAVVKFLRDRRDTNIHQQPVPMQTNTTIEVGTAVLTMSGGLSAVVIRGATGEQGGPIELDVALPPRIPPLPAIDESPRTTHTYVFKDWGGPEDVIALCTRYLAEIRRIVADGRALGFLTAQ